MENVELIEKLKNIKLLAMDVDGTLTDSAMYYSANGEELKRFHTRDGMAMNLLRKDGIDTAIITSEDSKIVMSRAMKLNIEHIIMDCRNKSTALRDLADQLELSLKEIAFIGDDINDYYVMKIAGVSACPAGATELILETADYICNKNGGNGAVREFAELILKTHNKPIHLTENW